MGEAYTGNACFLGHDEIAPDGRKLDGGWHYTVIETPDGGTMPGEKLWLDETEDGPVYRLAVEGDQSWFDRHPKDGEAGIRLIAPNGNIGAVKTVAELHAAHKHLDSITDRLGHLEPYEKDHLITSAADILVMRKELHAHEHADKLNAYRKGLNS